MLSNPRYIGRWAFGRRKNQWSSSKDSVLQIEQPEAEVIIVQSEELRIVSDELSFAVQERLAAHKSGSRGPKGRKEPRLWDLVTGCFVCADCSTPVTPVRLYQAGARGTGMRCKREALCPARTLINREEAVRNVCARLSELLAQDTELIAMTVAATREIEALDRGSVEEQLAQVDRKIAALSRRINDLSDMAGEGSDEDRAHLKARVRLAQQERVGQQAERCRIARILAGDHDPITPERVRSLLADLTGLLSEALDGSPDPVVLHRAATVFEFLVGGRIDVHSEPRPGRKQKRVRGTFVPNLLQTVCQGHPAMQQTALSPSGTVEVWLRRIPQKERLAMAVHQLVDIERHSFRSAADVLRTRGHSINSGVVWQIHQRYWQMQGLPVPDLPYNNGQPRDARGTQA
jgi:hypothetical protein